MRIYVSVGRHNFIIFVCQKYDLEQINKNFSFLLYGFR